MKTWIYIVSDLAFVAFWVLTQLKALHMFQLNGYKPGTHRRWLSRNLGVFVPGILVMVAAAATMYWGGIWVAVASVLCAALQWPRKAKKPLVFTKRVIRQCVTLTLLTVLALVGSSMLSFALHFGVIGVMALTAPLWVMVANFCNKPVEAAINRWFLNDAKRILKSCPDLLTIGVTGSYGKTSVKYILRTLLQAKYDCLMTPESYNTPMGVVLTVRNHLRPTHEVFVCEMGARNVGDIKELCDIVHPGFGIITSVGPQHLETFGSIENVKKTKFELADALPETGTLFLNGEDENIASYRHHVKNPVVTYGLHEGCDYYATDLSASSRGTTFTAHGPGGVTETFTAAMLGKHNVINIMGAIAICCELGIPLSKLKPQVRKLESVPHRLQLLHRGAVTVIDDAYNSNPSGSRAAIDALALFEGFKVLVTPGMVELGDRQDELNKAFGAYAAGVCDYVVLVGRKQAGPIREGLLEAGYPPEKIYVADALADGLEKAYGVSPMGQEKVILLENDLPDNF